ncbi:MAG: hypothetical protein ABSC54_00545 [Smithellaceae bacterium]
MSRPWYSGHRPSSDGNVITLSSVLRLHLRHPGRVGTGVEYTFTGLLKKVHRPPDHPEILRLPVGHKALLGIPFFKKKELIFIIDTLAEVVAPTPLLHPC